MQFQDKVIKPFTPVEVQDGNNQVKVGVIGREYIFSSNSLPLSIIAQEKELLSAPMRIVLKQHGKEEPFTTSVVRLFSHTQENAVIVGSMQTEEFIINTSFKVEYDGYCYIDIKLMPRGRTVVERKSGRAWD